MCVLAVKDVCRNVSCGHGSCVLTSAAPFYECKCRPPFRPPNCKKGPGFYSENSLRCHPKVFKLNRVSPGQQLLPADPIRAKTEARAGRVPNVLPSSVPALLATLESSAKLVNATKSLHPLLTQQSLHQVHLTNCMLT